MHEFTWIMMRISLTFSAQSMAVTLSSTMSGNGLYTSRSGNRSCTSDNETVANIMLDASSTKAVMNLKNRIGNQINLMNIICALTQKSFPFFLRISGLLAQRNWHIDFNHHRFAVVILMMIRQVVGFFRYFL